MSFVKVLLLLFLHAGFEVSLKLQVYISRNEIQLFLMLTNLPPLKIFFLKKKFHKELLSAVG